MLRATRKRASSTRCLLHTLSGTVSRRCAQGSSEAGKAAFEALLFSDCAAFAEAIARPHLREALQEIRDAFANPEEIDDSPNFAPSKRVQALVAGYQKPWMGTLAALAVGLDAMRDACPHFGRWLNRLERSPRVAAPAAT